MFMEKTDVEEALMKRVDNVVQFLKEKFAYDTQLPSAIFGYLETLDRAKAVYSSEDDTWVRMSIQNTIAASKFSSH